MIAFVLQDARDAEIKDALRIDSSIDSPSSSW